MTEEQRKIDKLEASRQKLLNRKYNCCKVIKKCLYCGDEFYTDKHKTQYCCASCAIKHKHILGNFDGNKKPIYKMCEICGKEYKARRKEQKYCSIKCRAESKRIAPRKIFTVKCNCDNCNKELNREPHTIKNKKNIYCSMKCKNEYTSSHLIGERAVRFKNKKKSFVCDHCGKEYKRFVDREYKNHFCSNKCKIQYYKDKRFGENNQNWKGGLSFLPYPAEFNRELKKIIIESDNYKCQICGEDLIDKRKCVHHIDYEKNNCNTENLILLCVSCHSKTNGKRSYWIDFFKQMKENG
jgi:hypothetical protein